MADTATLRTWLTEAEKARHALATGAQVVRLQHGGPTGRSTEFTPAKLADLEAYIASLRAQLSAADDEPRNTRRPFYFGY